MNFNSSVQLGLRMTGARVGIHGRPHHHTYSLWELIHMAHTACGTCPQERILRQPESECLLCCLCCVCVLPAAVRPAAAGTRSAWCNLKLNNFYKGSSGADSYTHMEDTVCPVYAVGPNPYGASFKLQSEKVALGSYCN